MKDLLKMSHLTPEELTHILDVADQLKAQQKLGGTAPLLAGKSVALMFSKASTRTRRLKGTVDVAKADTKRMRRLLNEA